MANYAEHDIVCAHKWVFGLLNLVKSLSKFLYNNYYLTF